MFDTFGEQTIRDSKSFHPSKISTNAIKNLNK